MEKNGRKSVMQSLLESGGWGGFSGDIKKLMAWEHWLMFADMLENLQRDKLFVSPVHGEGHIERVMLHGAFSAMENMLSKEDARLLLLMCAYHDTGRVSDWLDDLHGARSASKIGAITGADGEDLKILMAGIEAHSLNDAVMDGVIDRYEPQDRARCRRLAELLKDADGLDRVRISDLDVRYLRNVNSKNRADFAGQLYEMYIAEQERRGIPVPKKGDYFDSDLLKQVRNSLHRLYFEKNCNSAMATIVVLSELLGVEIDEQTVQAAAGMDGAGRYGAQCGLAEGALMFMGVYCSRRGYSAEVISAVCRSFAESFEKQYGSLMCRDLRPGGFRETDPPHMCAGLTIDTVLFTYEHILRWDHGENPAPAAPEKSHGQLC